MKSHFPITTNQDYQVVVSVRGVVISFNGVSLDDEPSDSSHILHWHLTLKEVHPSVWKTRNFTYRGPALLSTYVVMR